MEQQRAAALRRAAVRGTLARSVRNTQPWRFALSTDSLAVNMDASRQLPVLDPTNRQLLMSCGCALFNARLSLAAAGLAAEVLRFPDPLLPDLVALISAAEVDDGPVDPYDGLDAVVEKWETNRRPFTSNDVPADAVTDLVAAAEAEGAELLLVADDADHASLTALIDRADEIQHMNPAYVAEYRAWAPDDDAVDDPTHATSGTEPSAEPLARFGPAAVNAATSAPGRPFYALLGTRRDNPKDWLQAGEALQRVLLEATRHGLKVTLLTDVVEVPSTRASLRGQLRLKAYPHVLLRIGHAPSTPATRRRRLVEVLTEAV